MNNDNWTFVEACLLSVIGIATNIMGAMSVVAYVNGRPFTCFLLALAAVALVASLYLILKQSDQLVRKNAQERRVIAALWKLHDEIYPGDSMWATHQIAEVMGVKLDGND
jgi:NO-binding membrane sensor protein with MHYT domain